MEDLAVEGDGGESGGGPLTVCPLVEGLGLRDQERNIKYRGPPGDVQEQVLETSYVESVRRRCHCEGEVIDIRDHDARWDAEVEAGDVDEEEKGEQPGALGGPYRDRGRYARGALEDEGAPPPREEGRNPVDHVGRYVFG